MISIAISPCPNDTFGFYNLLTGHNSFKSSFFDIETLNQLAKAGSYDLIKMSASTFAHVTDTYRLLTTGTAFTTNSGPLLISRSHHTPMKNVQLAIPGRNTTAYFLYKLLFGEPREIIETHYSNISDFVLTENSQAGLLIHESRFSISKSPIRVLCDLGQEYFNRFSEHIPLGVVAIHKKTPEHIQKKLSQTLKQSFFLAQRAPQQPLAFARQFAQEKNPKIIKKHIQTYVSSETYNLDNVSLSSIKNFFSRGVEAGFFPKSALQFEIVQ